MANQENRFVRSGFNRRRVAGAPVALVPVTCGKRNEGEHPVRSWPRRSWRLIQTLFSTPSPVLLP